MKTLSWIVRCYTYETLHKYKTAQAVEAYLEPIFRTSTMKRFAKTVHIGV